MPGHGVGRLPARATAGLPAPQTRRRAQLGPRGRTPQTSWRLSKRRSQPRRLKRQRRWPRQLAQVKLRWWGGGGGAWHPQRGRQALPIA